MPANARPGGAVGVGIFVHADPSHVHVSFKELASALEPPNRTVLPRAASKAIAAPLRGGGASALMIRVHVTPSPVHVWVGDGQATERHPPKSTTWPATWS